MYKYWFLIIGSILFFSCSDEDGEMNPKPIELIFNFTNDEEGWIGDFADYPPLDESDYDLEYGHSRLPSPLDQKQGSLKQSGDNHSDDLFMYVKKKITGLTPNTKYEVNFNLEIASNASGDSFGIGGGPGVAVTIKAGMTLKEPQKSLSNLDYYRMDIDKGNQASEGKDMVVLGDFSNGGSENVYALKTLSNSTPFTIQTDENGELWAIFGTDSGFEGRTTIYYNKITINLK